MDLELLTNISMEQLEDPDFHANVPSQVPGQAPATAQREAGGNKELDLIRSILLGPELQKVSDDQARTQEIARLLPAALAQRLHTDVELAGAMQGFLQKSLEAYAKEHAAELADALMPALLRAVLRAPLYPLRKLIGKGLWRGGKAKEIAIERRKTARGPARGARRAVEQIVLLHGRSGRVLAQAYATSEHGEDAKTVANTVAAFQTFLTEFPTRRDLLRDIHLPPLHFIIHAGEHASALAIVRGKPPQHLHGALRGALTRIHEVLGAQLQASNPELKMFKECAAILANCE
jgi:hypothetical protein